MKIMSMDSFPAIVEKYGNTITLDDTAGMLSLAAEEIIRFKVPYEVTNAQLVMESDYWNWKQQRKDFLEYINYLADNNIIEDNGHSLFGRFFYTPVEHGCFVSSHPLELLCLFTCSNWSLEQLNKSIEQFQTKSNIKFYSKEHIYKKYDENN